MLLASLISEKQDTTAYLCVLALALRNYGAPEAIVTDSGGVYYSKRAMAIYNEFATARQHHSASPLSPATTLLWRFRPNGPLAPLSGKLPLSLEELEAQATRLRVALKAV